MALYYYTTTTLLGIVLSVTLVQTIRPGDSLKNKNILTPNATRYSMTMDTILDLFRYFTYDVNPFLVFLFISCSLFISFLFVHIVEILCQIT